VTNRIVSDILHKIRRLLTRTVTAWFEDDAVHWGAAIAFYTIFSLGPLMLLGMSLLEGLVGAPLPDGRFWNRSTCSWERGEWGSRRR